MKKFCLLFVLVILFVVFAAVRITINISLVPYFLKYGFMMGKHEKYFSSEKYFREFVDSLGVDLSTVEIQLMGNGGTQAAYARDGKIFIFSNLAGFSDKVIKRFLLHELVHIDQFKRGDFKVSFIKIDGVDKEVVTWKGVTKLTKEWENSSTIQGEILDNFHDLYHSSAWAFFAPWEREAYNNYGFLGTSKYLFKVLARLGLYASGIFLIKIIRTWKN